MNRIKMEDFPREVQLVFEVDSRTDYFREDLLPNISTEDLQLALDTLMMVDSSRSFELLRKRYIREEIKTRENRKTSIGIQLIEEWNAVTSELREKFKKGAVWVK